MVKYGKGWSEETVNLPIANGQNYFCQRTLVKPAPIFAFLTSIDWTKMLVQAVGVAVGCSRSKPIQIQMPSKIRY